uniref:Phosphodiester glycosidase domain-containing protein n=1 Tax=Byssovorax cruenta TaxID=293647 RepID=A0A3S5GXY6_9BACT|nr:hypothetical protein [Byssovorax cruenta]
MTTQSSSLRRRALVGLGFFAVAVPGLWVAIHQVPGFGPAVVDGVRAVVGPKPIAWAEDVAYGIEDQIDRWRYEDAAPKTFWEQPADTSAPLAAPERAFQPAALTATAPVAPEPHGGAFPPPAFAPPYADVAYEGDGRWLPMKDGSAPGEAPALWKSVVHPDPKRSFAAVAVVAIDLSRVDLRLVAGTSEPASETVPPEHRPGIIPREAAPTLIAVFNGGFKAMHGHWGMMLNGETFVPPRDVACTVALYRDGAIKIRTWPELSASEGQMVGYRQTPPCLVEEGKTNAALDVEYTKGWGATVSGQTVIRRSAIGLDKAGRTLFFAIGESVTAQSLSRAMKAVGAENAAQLDVNYAYPRFLMYERASGSAPPRATSALIPGIKFMSHEYVGDASPRDFFYLTRHRAAL